jgi:DNA polymerase-3 subunit gamma/tau
VALALYRKYRPRTFAEVIGQEHVTEPLMQALRSGRLNHAYLFSGPRGCGKTSSARILARSLNCEKGPTPEPCGTCDSCVALAPDGAGSIDVIEIDAASHGGVDDARDLRERAIFAPIASRFKVYVIDEAHMVSSAGFNALLKLVEEPPEYVKFVFATTEPEKVLGTIKSRTHHYPFRLIPPGVLRPYLEQLCAREGVTVEPAVFPLVVRAGGGSARDSLSVLDQLIAGAGAEGVTYARAVALLGVTDVALIDEMCDALAAGDGAAAFSTVDRVAEAGHDPRRFASDLLERLRDLIVLQQVPDAAAKGLLDAPDDELARMALQAQRFGAATLSRMADIVHNGLTEMRGTTAPRLLLELISARMLLPGADDSAGARLQRLERMERRLTVSGEAPAAPVPPPAPEILDASTPQRGSQRPRSTPLPEAGLEPVPEAGLEPAPEAGSEVVPEAGSEVVPEAGSEVHPAVPGGTGAAPAPTGALRTGGVLDAQAVRRVWDEILGYVGRKSRRVGAVAREATVREVDGPTLVLLFKHQVHATMLANGPELLVEAVYEVLGAPSPDASWQVRCEVAGQGPGSGGIGAPVSPVPPSPTGASASENDGWPATAQPGGAAWTGPEPPPSSAAPSAAVSKPATAPAQRRGQPGSPAGGVGKASGSGAGPTTAGGTLADGTSDDRISDSRTSDSRTSDSRTSDSRTNDSRTGTGRTGTGRTAGGGRSTGGSSAGRTATGRTTGGGPGRGRSTGGSSATGSSATGSSAGGSNAGRLARNPAVDVSPPDEPPYDPDYDTPVRDTGGYEGFDPGDEPLDEVIDEQTVRQTSEQQALHLLQQGLGAEKIGELDPST